MAKENPTQDDVAQQWYDMGVNAESTDGAIACFKMAVLVDSNYTDAYNALGKIFEEQGLVKEADIYFEKVKELGGKKKSPAIKAKKTNPISDETIMQKVHQQVSEMQEVIQAYETQVSSLERELEEVKGEQGKWEDRFKADFEKRYKAEFERKFKADFEKRYKAEFERKFKAEIERKFKTDFKKRYKAEFERKFKAEFEKKLKEKKKAKESGLEKKVNELEKRLKRVQKELDKWKGKYRSAEKKRKSLQGIINLRSGMSEYDDVRTVRYTPTKRREELEKQIRTLERERDDWRGKYKSADFSSKVGMPLEKKANAYMGYYRAGKAFLKSEMYETAIRHFQISLDLKPSTVNPSLKHIYRAYINKNKLLDALRYFHEKTNNKRTTFESYLQAVIKRIYKTGTNTEKAEAFKCCEDQFKKNIPYKSWYESYLKGFIKQAVTATRARELIDKSIAFCKSRLRSHHRAFYKKYLKRLQAR